MVYIFFSVCFLSIITFSFGISIFRLINYSYRNPFFPIFFGVGCLGTCAMLLSIFIPLSSNIMLLLCLLCIPGGFLSLRIYLNDIKSCTKWIIFFCFLVGLYSIVFSFFKEIGYSDTGGYHLQIVKWLNEYGIVPGLGNIHTRLSQPSIWLPFSALFNHFFLKDILPWVMFPFFISSFICYVLWEIFEKNNILKIYNLLILPAVIFESIPRLFPNLYYDYPSLLFNLILGSEVIYLALVRGNKNIALQEYAVILLFVSFAFLIKQVVLVSVLVMAFWVLFSVKNKRALLKIFFVPFIIGIIYCSYNVVSSGYPFFPSDFIYFNVDWKIPENLVKSHKIDILGWARYPKEGYQRAYFEGISFWFFDWLKFLISTISYKFKFIFGIVFPLILGLVFCFSFILKKRDWFVLLILWPLFSIVFWFLVAPDPRFGLEHFLLFSALGGALCAFYKQGFVYQFFLSVFANRITCEKAVSCYLFFFFLGCGSVLLLNIYIHCHDFQLVKPQDYTDFSTKKVLISREQNFYIYQPNNKDGNISCGASSLPCTYYDCGNLFLRQSGSLKSGFSYYEKK